MKIPVSIPIAEKPANVCKFDSKNDYKLESYLIATKLFINALTIKMYGHLHVSLNIKTLDGIGFLVNCRKDLFDILKCLASKQLKRIQQFQCRKNFLILLPG